MAKNKTFKDTATMELLGVKDNNLATFKEQDHIPEDKYQDDKLAFEPKIEPKSRRVQLIFQPSFYTQIQERAKNLGVSVNAYINALAKQDISSLKKST